VVLGTKYEKCPDALIQLYKIEYRVQGRWPYNRGCSVNYESTSHSVFFSGHVAFDFEDLGFDVEGYGCGGGL